MLVKPVATNVSRGIDRGTYNGKSITLNGVDQYLSNTFSVNDGDTFTLSYWVKFHELDRSQTHFGNTGSAALFHHSTNAMGINDDGATDPKTTELQRDTSGWHHVVFNGNGTTNNLWINNVAQTFTATNVGDLNTAVAHYLGYNASYGYAHISIADLYFCSSNAYTPDNFAHVSADTGKWVITNVSTVEASISYGSNNGCHLIFDDNANDSSGEGNNWTENGSTFVYTSDTPVDNHDLFNFLEPSVSYPVTYSNGNRTITRVGGGQGSGVSSLPMREGHLVYLELEYSSSAKNFGLTTNPSKSYNGSEHTPGYITDTNEFDFGYQSNGKVLEDGVVSGTTYTTWTTGDRMGMAIDTVNGYVFIRKNGTWINSGDPIAGTGYLTSYTAGQDVYLICSVESGASCEIFINENDWNDSAPTGYTQSSSANLPTDNVDFFPQDKANIVLATGTAAELAVTNTGFQPDFTWAKNRDVANHHEVYDSVRGALKKLITSLTNAEATETQTLKSFDSDGFTWGTDTGVNGSGNDFWALGLLADNTSGSSNTDGSITSTVASSGYFSIATFTKGSGTDTFGHSLNRAPNLVIIKRLDSASNWFVYHSSNTSAPETDGLYLESTAATADDSTFWNDTAPTSSVVTVSSGLSAGDYVAYCFVFGDDSPFTGGVVVDNSSADGAFIYTNELLMYCEKMTSTTGDWDIHGQVRSTYNPTGHVIKANSSAVEASTPTIDFLSNGIKKRTSQSGTKIWWGIKKNGGQLAA